MLTHITGTTAVTLLLLDNYMIVSNVGDSEAVVCRDGKAVQLSTLHTPLNEDEKKRVGKLSTYNIPFFYVSNITRQLLLEEQL